MKPVTELIQGYMGIDVTDPEVRRRAWRRIPVYYKIAEECEQDGNTTMADTLRRIVRRVTAGADDDETLIELALLAGIGDDTDDCV